MGTVFPGKFLLHRDQKSSIQTEQGQDKILWICMKTIVYSMIGDFLALLHFLFILYVLLGVVLVYFYPPTIWLHIPSVVWGFFVQWYDWPCPLTVAEKQIRKSTGEEGIKEGFIAHHLGKFMISGSVNLQLNYILAGIVLLCNIIGYGWLYF